MASFPASLPDPDVSTWLFRGVGRGDGSLQNNAQYCKSFQLAAAQGYVEATDAVTLLKRMMTAARSKRVSVRPKTSR
jgi:hypothetical protein